MTQSTINFSIDEIYSKPTEKFYITNKTNVYHIDEIWSLDILNEKDNGTENNRGYRYAFVVIDIFFKFGCTVPLKKIAQIKKVRFGNIRKNLRKKTISLKTDRGKEFLNDISADFLNKNNVKRYSRYTPLGAVFAGKIHSHYQRSS